jgi:hypothetical protein
MARANVVEGGGGNKSDERRRMDGDVVDDDVEVEMTNELAGPRREEEMTENTWSADFRRMVQNTLYSPRDVINKMSNRRQ